MAKTLLQRYREHNRKTGKVLTPSLEKKDVISADGRVKVEIGYDENPVSAQYPFPTDGDSVYAKDIDLANSDIGDFSGSILTMFDDYRTSNHADEITNNGVNPKSFVISLNRPVLSSFVGIGSANTSLSNAKVIIRGLDGTTIKEIDSSADSTKRGVVIAQFEQSAFIEVVVEFYTDDAVSVGGLFIQKSSYVTIGAIDGLIPFDQSTVVPLLAGATFTSGILDTKNYGIIIVATYSDVASAVDGLVIEFSTDKVNWRWTDKYTPPVGEGKSYTIQPQSQYLRVRYTNGIVDQGVFDLQTQIKPVYIKPSSHRVADLISGQDDAELVKANLTGLSELTGDFENVQTFRGSLNVNTALVHQVGISFLFHRLNGFTTTTAVDITAGDTSFTLTSVVGLIVGDILQGETGSPTGELLITVTAIVGNVVTGDAPIPLDVPAGAQVDTVVTNMASTVGTLASPVIYQIKPPAGAIWQITRLLISITDSTAMDDGKFGGIPSLTNGVLLRASQGGVVGAQTNWKNNGDLALEMYDVLYTTKAPSGAYGLRGRWSFTKGEFIVQLNGDTEDVLEFLIQDDITANTSFEVKAQGRLFGG